MSDRSVSFNFRMTPAEHEAVRLEAKARGLSMATFIRARVAQLRCIRCRGSGIEPDHESSAAAPEKEVQKSGPGLFAKQSSEPLVLKSAGQLASDQTYRTVPDHDDMACQGCGYYWRHCECDK